ncbi:acid-activated periplasmic chaperone HdeB [Dryocola sp. BD626]|uniref:acid-activated periplasmic chaperone HdeB n=1 Tax=Dryocola sp. BD626 TaxID=3133273 RepID=UPI003F50B17E
MNIKKAVALIIASVAVGASINTAFALQETTPQNMTCQEFIDMNPRTMTPIAFWVVNKNTDFKGGDYVDWHEVETVSVPQMVKECHQNPKAKLGELALSK